MGELPNGPWDTVELVVYTSQLDDLEWDPDDGIPVWCRDTGLASVGLWARNDNTELPVVNIAPHGIINSYSTAHSVNTESKPVSTTFIEMMAEPATASQEQYDQLPPREQLVINILREHLYTQDEPAPEVLGIVEWCRERADQ